MVGPMRKPFIKLLKLTCNTTLIVDKTNTTFWDNCGELDTVFPGDGDLRMAIFPCAFALGYCSVALNSLELLVAAFNT